MTRAGIIARRKFRGSFGKNVALFRKRHKCEKCGKNTLRRISLGIWHCTNCNMKMAAKAYLPKVSTIEEILQQEMEKEKIELELNEKHKKSEDSVVKKGQNGSE
jgi:ribosomal protein L37AE/L43A